jgi:hypothetical protein
MIVCSMLGRSLFTLAALGLLLAATPRLAHGAPKAKPKAAPAAQAKKGKAPAKAKAEKEPEAPQEGEKDAAQSDKEGETSTAAEDAKNASKEESVKNAGTAAPKAQDTGSVKVKEDKEGVKTYKFETVEVEGRLKSPQVIYFLRRVRAEFEAGALGHRSFLGELSDSRRSAAFR